MSAACWLAPSQIFASGPSLVAGCGLKAPQELEFEFVVSLRRRTNPNGHGLKGSDLDLDAVFRLGALSCGEKWRGNHEDRRAGELDCRSFYLLRLNSGRPHANWLGELVVVICARKVSFWVFGIIFHIRIESDSSKTFRNRIRRPSNAKGAENLENVTQSAHFAHLAHF